MEKKRTHQVQSLSQFLELVRQEPIQVPEVTTLPESVSMLMPANLYMRRDLLIELLKANLLAMDENMSAMALTDDERVELKAVRAQRDEFLAWAQRETAEYLFMGLYPVNGNLPVEDEDAE